MWEQFINEHSFNIAFTLYIFNGNSNVMQSTRRLSSVLFKLVRFMCFAFTVDTVRNDARHSLLLMLLSFWLWTLSDSSWFISYENVHIYQILWHCRMCSYITYFDAITICHFRVAKEQYVKCALTNTGLNSHFYSQTLIWLICLIALNCLKAWLWAMDFYWNFVYLLCRYPVFPIRHYDHSPYRNSPHYPMKKQNACRKLNIIFLCSIIHLLVWLIGSFIHSFADSYASSIAY